MVWIALGTVILAATAAGVWYASRSGTEKVPSEEHIDMETLRSTLDRAGIDRESTRIPDAKVLGSHISESDQFLAAVQSRRGNKRCILVALGDRIVAGEATLGAMGAEVLTIDWSEVTHFEQSFDIGGEFRIETAESSYTFTHVPRSQTREFADVVEERIHS